MTPNCSNSPRPVTEVLLIRHGETEWNREGRMQGHLDIPLSREGVAQAARVAERLSGEPFDVLVSSDLRRAFQTAQRIADRTGRPVRVDARLRERNLGVLQALTRAESARRLPEVFRRYESGEADFEIPGGESQRAFFERVIGALTEIAREHPGRRVVVVSHGGVLDALYRHASGEGPEGPRAVRLLNASVNEFQYTSSGWILGRWGDVAHLTEPSLDDV